MHKTENTQGLKYKRSLPPEQSGSYNILRDRVTNNRLHENRGSLRRYQRQRRKGEEIEVQHHTKGK